MWESRIKDLGTSRALLATHEGTAMGGDSSTSSSIACGLEAGSLSEELLVIQESLLFSHEDYLQKELKVG